ncbi:ribosome maturation factor RimP [Clostridium sp. BJN0001]|uniref:ribosome maturation factor RimP n=1 Tax=Clostridium sp. BJN0001 TaxID=2930219 RepID=UPI001FCFC8DE|nr:ribosome maturation factor RimP [Clostridium sp. BJN0001]
MNRSVLLDKIESFVKPIVENSGYELYHVEYVKEDGRNYLRIYIDNSARSISLNDCENVSRKVSDILDEKDPIGESYYLEVSSPGLNRRLFTDEHIKKFIGSLVKVILRSAINGTKTITGKLEDFRDNIIIVDADEKIEIPKDKIKTINLDGEI